MAYFRLSSIWHQPLLATSSLARTIGIVVTVCFLTSWFINESALGQSKAEGISFDIPALLHAVPIVEGPSEVGVPVTSPEALAKADSRTVVAKPAVHSRTTFSTPPTHDEVGPSEFQWVRIVIPVTGEIQDSRKTVESIRFDVYWNRVAHPLHDYFPRTQTTSRFATPIGIETRNEQKRGAGLSLSAKYETLVNGSLNGQWAGNESTTRRFEEHPQHDVLVASGTSHRGTGAFFRFHPSRFETVEGGRELSLIYCVPKSWRGGILKVECKANGITKNLWKEKFEFGRAFVVPVYLQSDAEARRMSNEFVQAEQQLRARWQTSIHSLRETESMWRISLNSKSKLPEQWVHYLIQTGNDDYLTQYRKQLPKSLLEAAEDFVGKRNSLLKLSR